MKNRKSILALAALVIVLAGCTTAKVAETPPGSGHYTTNVVVDPKLEAALTTIGSVNAATTPVNPFSGLITIGLAAITAGASWFAKRKNDALNATIAGVEKAGTPEVKKAIMNEAISAGVEASLNKSVQNVTGG